MEKLNYKTLFYFIIFLVILLSFVNLGTPDLYSDNSLYAFRSLGWTDYLGSGQSGPLGWLGKTTWWSGLSFHDHPPLLMLLEKMSMLIFGDNAFGVKFPSVLAGVSSILVLFYGIKLLKDKETALLASVILSVSSLAFWSNNSGNLEGIESFFIILTFINTTLYFKYNKTKYLYFGMIAMGLSFLSKYSAIFLVPSFLATFYIKMGSFSNLFTEIKTEWKKYSISILIFISILTPVIIYNYNLYTYQKTFDLSLSVIAGTSNVLDRNLNVNFAQNILDIITSLVLNNSLPFIILLFLGAFYLMLKCNKKTDDIVESSVVYHMLMLFLMFCFLGGNIRWLPITLPFLSIALAISIVDLDLSKKYKKNIIYIALSVILLVEFGYLINTNIITNPVGVSGITYSSTRNQNFGLNELDAYLRNIFKPLPKIEKIETKNELGHMDEKTLYKSKHIVIYDGRINWFSTWWYFEKYRINYRLPVFSMDNNSVKHLLFKKNEVHPDLREKTNATVYFVYILNKQLIDATKINDSYYEGQEKLVKYLDSSRTPFDIVSSKKGEPAFKVYKILP